MLPTAPPAEQRAVGKIYYQNGRQNTIQYMQYTVHSTSTCGKRVPTQSAESSE